MAKKATIKAKAPAKVKKGATETKKDKLSLNDVSPLQRSLAEMAVANSMAFGDGVTRTGLTGSMSIRKVKTDVAGIDYKFGGIPVGKVIEVFGPEGAGKTTLCATVARAFRREFPDKAVSFIDVEHALDPEYCKQLGWDVEDGNNLFSQPDCAEDAFEIMKDHIRSGHVSLIILDSVSALTPKAELEGDIGKSQMGIQARLMSIVLRKMISEANKNNVTVMFTNQLRGTMGYGNTTSGGNALKYYTSLRIEIKVESIAKSGIVEDGIVIGRQITAIAVKNKGSAPFVPINLSLIYGVGYDREASVLDMAIKFDVITEKGGGHLSFTETQAPICQGKPKFRLIAKENPQMVEDIKVMIEEKANKIKESLTIDISEFNVEATKRTIDFAGDEALLMEKAKSTKAYFDGLKGKKDEAEGSDNDLPVLEKKSTEVTDFSSDEDLFKD